MKTPLELILEAWATAIQIAIPEVTRCYFAEIDRRTAMDDGDLAATGSAQPELPYVEILSWDPTNTPQGMSGMEIESHKIVVTGSWPRPADSSGQPSTTQDRTIEAHAVGRVAATVRKAINARMLAHNTREDTIDGVGMTTLITWANRIRPATDNVSDVDEFAIEATFSHFPIADA